MKMMLQTFVQIFVWLSVFISCGYVPRNRVSGWFANSVSNILRTARLLSKANTFNFPISNAWCFQFLNFLTIPYWLFYYSVLVGGKWYLSVDFLFDFNLLRQHWSEETYRFQVHISMIQICNLHCVPVIQSQTVFCHYTLGALRPSPQPLYPLPSGNHHTAICVHDIQFYIPHMNEIIRFCAFSDWLILFNIIFLSFIQVVAVVVFCLVL